jgi:hypothetical protein
MDGFVLLKMASVLLVFVSAGAGWWWLSHGEHPTPKYADLRPSGVLFWITAGVWAIVVLVQIIIAGDGVACKNKARTMGLEYHYSISAACMVNDGGTWVPIEQVFTNHPTEGSTR